MMGVFVVLICQRKPYLKVRPPVLIVEVFAWVRICAHVFVDSELFRHYQVKDIKNCDVITIITLVLVSFLVSSYTLSS